MAVHVVPPIAGIRIVHHVDDGISLAPPVNAGWRGSPESEDPLALSHVLGDISVHGLAPVMELPPWSTYYADAEGRISIRFYSHEEGVPEFLLRTDRPGFEYTVCYASTSSAPLTRMDKEMSAYTLALASRRRGLIAHGCGFLLPNGLAALCLGVSGAGKSTLAGLMLDCRGVSVLNDDRIAVTREPDGLHAWSTPWPGRAGIAVSGDARLGVVAFISRGDTRAISEIRPRDALYRLLSTVALPLWSPAEADDALALLERLITEVPTVDIRYPLEPSPGDWIVRTLSDLVR